ncbi:MAG: DUF420 domain-containing protein [Planctomycetota bacterium]
MIAAFDFRVLADVNAALNALALLCIIIGLAAIKRRKERLHIRMMLTATAISAVFLISYLTYHANAEPVKYEGQGIWRIIYFTILIPHVILAIVMVPLIITTIVLGLRDRREKHRRFARITAPIWLFVSVTGVLYYVVLYWL